MQRRTFLAHAAGFAAAGALLPPAFLRDGFAATDGGPTREIATRGGKVRGRIVDGVHCFKNIPYGASTAGANRFLPPQPAAPWTGVKDCFEWGHYAPQSNRARGAKQLEYFGLLRAESRLGPSEDCLNLNVWAKSASDGAKRPVMVW